MTSEPTDRGPRRVDAWRVGRYRIEAVLGTGTFATVYRAVDDRLEDTVAVKVLAENHSLDPEIRKRFLTEGRVLRRIDSPHVVEVHDLGETERQQPFLVLEYASRGTLAERARELRAMGWRPGPTDLWAVAEPLAEALDAVHRAGVVHRDLNPTNVLLSTRGASGRARAAAAMVRDDERVVLADLGLCKDLARHSGHTSGGGTDGFRPPELRFGPAIVDGRADLWSLSAVLVWLTTGSPPGPSGGTALVGTSFPLLAPVLDRGLADDPQARHPDARVWLSDVAAALRLPEVEVQPAAGPTDGGGWRPGPSAQPVAGVRVDGPVPRRWGWRLRHSIWLLSSLPFGVTTWAGFLYIGMNARRRGWLRAAAAYGAGGALVLGLMLGTPTGTDDDPEAWFWWDTVGATTMLALWLGGFVHALVANRRWLRWLAGEDSSVGGIKA